MNKKLHLVFGLILAFVISFGFLPGGNDAIVHRQENKGAVIHLVDNAPTPGTGKIYQQGKYPNKHKFTIRAKALSTDHAADVAELWICPRLIPSYYNYYFSSFYQSYINAILNGNDPLRGPPAC